LPEVVKVNVYYEDRLTKILVVISNFFLDLGHRHSAKTKPEQINHSSSRKLTSVVEAE
jgi:hypothetical protein